MTQQDADQLEAWVREMDTRSLRLLWKWLLMEWARRVHDAGGREETRP